jgi:hypothetical protein
LTLGSHVSWYSTFGFKCPVGFSKKNKIPQMVKFGIERSSKMKVVCTWGWRFGLRVDIGEVTEVIS